MYDSKMYELGAAASVIRTIFEYGNARKKEIGADNVFDFSIGNPSVPAPAKVNETICDLVKNMDSVALHGYTSSAGDYEVRQTIAENLNSRFGTDYSGDNVYMTVGAAASLTVTIHALCEAEDEFVVIAPFFPEYRVFIEGAGAKVVVVPAMKPSFQINFEALEQAITPHTKAIIINSPNNPSGVVYTTQTIEKLAELLRKKEAEYGKPIFLISDEPYRELVYDVTTDTPFPAKIYENTIICYSFSKSISLPGERIGYILVPNSVKESKAIFAAVCGAGRALGFVCAPSLFQRVAAACINEKTDLTIYRTNRDLLYQALTEYGFHCVYPDGAFYLFVEALEEDAEAFCDKAKAFELLLVPADSFDCPGYVRISYCVSTDMVRRSLPAFAALAKSYGK